MQSSQKYLIHAEIRADGVVQRSDVVGAIFGQTEGLLGDQLDLRDLQESSKLGHIDVSIDAEDGRTFGTVTISSGLDRVETAVLAAALETIERVGPCRAECTITQIEDARAAKRRELVDRATELLTELEDKTITSEQIVEEVRQQTRIEEITEYDGLPAGPRVADSDAIIIVEGRADVRQLLKYGIKNAIAVEGTDIPDAIATLTRERNTTAFLDGDRGGDLILEELIQVGDVDYVAFAPSSESVEDLDRATILAALRKKVPYEHIAEEERPREVVSPPPAKRMQTDETAGSETAAEAKQAEPTAENDIGRDAGADGAVGESDREDASEVPDGTVASTDQRVPTDGTSRTPANSASQTTDSQSTTETEPASETGSETGEETKSVAGESGDSSGTTEQADGNETAKQPATTLPGHVSEVIEAESGLVRLLDETFSIIDERAAGAAFEALETAETVPETVVMDGSVSQRLLDIASQRGVGQIVATETGEFVKQPTNIRVRKADAVSKTEQ